ncbi:MAG TPA: uroporphyrinogen decarboxylase [Methylovirgula sp.]|nr:uroporphyrinogen decarboxylase [Methylovirgula sp.]
MAEPHLAEKKILRVLSGETISPPPIWLMRQAGRYLPEYRELRAKASSFLEFCYTPELAAEATLQPIRRFGFDAAIIFSDILVVPDAFGQKVWFESGAGPRLTPIADAADLTRLRATIDLNRLAPVFDAIGRVKRDLPKETALIGFCGAPFTVAAYMVAGESSSDQAPARLLAYRDPGLFQELIDRLVLGSIDYLARQIEAGVEIVQIFDSWAGMLPEEQFARWCVAPVRAIIEAMRERHADVKIIAFPRRAGLALPEFAASTGADALGLDAAVDPFAAAKLIAPATALQGNLDPLALVAGGDALREATARILSAFAGRLHIFNLGHGILPETPIAHVEALLAQVRSGC